MQNKDQTCVPEAEGKEGQNWRKENKRHILLVIR